MLGWPPLMLFCWAAQATLAASAEPTLPIAAEFTERASIRASSVGRRGTLLLVVDTEVRRLLLSG